MILEKQFYNINEAAEILGCSTRTIYNQRLDGIGIGPYFKKPMAGKLRISKEDLERAISGEMASE